MAFILQQLPSLWNRHNGEQEHREQPQYLDGSHDNPQQTHFPETPQLNSNVQPRMGSEYPQQQNGVYQPEMASNYPQAQNSSHQDGLASDLQQQWQQQVMGFGGIPHASVQPAAFGNNYVKEEPTEAMDFDNTEYMQQQTSDPSTYEQLPEQNAIAENPFGQYFNNFMQHQDSSFQQDADQAFAQSAFDPSAFPHLAEAFGFPQPNPHDVQQPEANILQSDVQQSIEEDSVLGDGSESGASCYALAQADRDAADNEDRYSEYKASDSDHADDEGSGSDSDDDKPLLTRFQNPESSHGSSKSRSLSCEVIAHLSSPPKPKPKPARKEKTVVKTEQRDNTNPAPALAGSETQQSMQEEQVEDVAEATAEDDASPPLLNFKLPTFEIRYMPPATANALPTAKISVPGLVLENIILSIDHHAIEAYLYEKVFLPSEQATHAASPDAYAELDTRLSVLNFHTIAILCIEAFISASSPDADLLPTGEAEASGANPNGVGRKRKPPTAKDLEAVDMDQVFFAVMDKYRIGLLAQRDNYNAIRGVQEFCDVALELCFWIKEHGLAPPKVPKASKAKDKDANAGSTLGTKTDGTQRVRAERKDKGVKRGARKEKDTEKEYQPEPEAGGSGFAKAKKGGKVNVLEAKKKAKTGPKLTLRMGNKATASGKAAGAGAAGKVRGGRVEKKKK